MVLMFSTETIHLLAAPRPSIYPQLKSSNSDGTYSWKHSTNFRLSAVGESNQLWILCQVKHHEVTFLVGVNHFNFVRITRARSSWIWNKTWGRSKALDWHGMARALQRWGCL